VTAEGATGQRRQANISIAAMMSATSRRSFLRAGAMTAAAACALSTDELNVNAAVLEKKKTPGKIKLGVCSYSFHKFDRAHVIEFVKQLNTPWLNCKDVNDHLPMKPPSATDEAIAAYKAAGIEVTSAGVIYFTTKDATDIQQKFEYAKRAGVKLIVGAPTREVLPDVESFVKQYDMRRRISNGLRRSTFSK
jgi:hypothetical protein